jgi:phosphatidate cytidylyltransferase
MDEALKQRVVTGVILIIAVLLGVTLLPNSVFSIDVLIAFGSLGGWEWARMVGFEEDKSRGLFVLSLLVFCLIPIVWHDTRWFFIVAGVVFWAIALVLLATYEQGIALYKENKWILRLAAFFVLIPAWSALVTLHAHQPALVLYLIFLVAITDSGAYFSGKRVGKTKLAPELSPGKTREGVYGGVTGAFIWSILGAIYLGVSGADWFYFIFLSVAVAFLSVAGDLFESLIKREAGQKDSGNILPGHGGILDRVDGLIATLPLFTLGIFWGGIAV